MIGGDISMSRVGMARHTENAFFESNAVRILAESLEQDHRIKTFFKENDRTPNYDGSLELVGAEGEPKKQFVVQIKKTNSLKCATKGKHKDKYVYDLETAFLYYIKAKVTESPAIYFVVDVDNKRIFYLHLTDDELMNMNFEGKAKVRYAFGNNNILTDLSKFCDELSVIAKERNEKYIFKTEEEIADMQEAVEYLNMLLDSDLLKIKEYTFPGLWRFGIGISQSDQFELRHYSRELQQEVSYKPERTNAFCLYPQYRGKIDSNVGEFKSEGYFKSFDCVGKNTPMDYVKGNLGKIIQGFCQNPPMETLPTVCLHELVYNRALKIHHLFLDGDTLLSSDSFSEAIIMLRYLDHIIFGHPHTLNEKRLRDQIVRGPHKIRLFDDSTWENVKHELKLFYDNHYNDDKYQLHMDAVLCFIREADLRYIGNISELRKRENAEIKRVWNYNPTDFLIRKEYLEVDLKPICEKWFNTLPAIYSEVYSLIFGNNMKYKFFRDIEYCIEDNTDTDSFLTVLAKARVYEAKTNKIDIRYADNLSTDFSEVEKERGLQHILSGEIFAASILNRIPTLYYDGIRCFLYQGICDALGIKCEGITINNRRERLLY